MAKLKMHSESDSRKPLPVEEARRLLAYDPETGLFTWRVNRRGKGMAGTTAGHLTQTGYIAISINNRAYLGHRLAWFMTHGSWAAGEIDHKDRDRSNNRLANLRIATVSQNQHNRPAPSNNTSGFKGVRYHKGYGKWWARIMVNGKRHDLGFFDTAAEGGAAYAEAAKRFHGEFACAA